jgi:hypothetical protein
MLQQRQRHACPFKLLHDRVMKIRSISHLLQTEARLLIGIPEQFMYTRWEAGVGTVNTIYTLFRQKEHGQPTGPNFGSQTHLAALAITEMPRAHTGLIN